MIGEIIKEKRTQLNMSQEELAGLMGCSVFTIHRWEIGKHKPSQLAVKRLKQVLKLKGEVDAPISYYHGNRQ